MRALLIGVIVVATGAPALAQPPGGRKLRSSQSAVCAADPEQVTATIRANRCPIAADGGPVVELWTMGQGDLMVEKFGHAALCICREGGRSTCYN